MKDRISKIWSSHYSVCELTRDDNDYYHGNSLELDRAKYSTTVFYLLFSPFLFHAILLPSQPTKPGKSGKRKANENWYSFKNKKYFCTCHALSYIAQTETSQRTNSSPSCISILSSTLSFLLQACKRYFRDFKFSPEQNWNQQITIPMTRTCPHPPHP